MNKANQFTEKFIKIFVKEFPHWESYINIMQDDDRGCDGGIYIEIPAPNIKKSGSIRITTDNEEITIKQWLQSRINRKIKEGLKYEYKDTVVFKVIRNKQKEET